MLDFKAMESLVEKVNAKRNAEGFEKKITLHESETQVAGHGIISWNVDFGWRWMFGITALPAFLFSCCCFRARESQAGWSRMASPSKPAMC